MTYVRLWDRKRAHWRFWTDWRTATKHHWHTLGAHWQWDYRCHRGRSGPRRKR